MTPKELIHIIELIIPALSTGILLMGITITIYVYIRFKEQIYLSLIFVFIGALVFAGSELAIQICRVMEKVELSIHFHRTEQLGGAFFLFALPFFLSKDILQLEKIKKISLYMSYCGFIYFIFTAIMAYVNTDLFISQTAHKYLDTNIIYHYGRGKEGILYVIRDILLFFAIFYSVIILIIEIIKSKKPALKIFSLIGILIAIYGAADDVYYVYNYSYFGFFPKIIFSRFSLGLTVFALLLMSVVFANFINEVKNVNKAYTNLDNAYRILHKSEIRFRQLAEMINEIFIIYDYNNKIISYVNPSYETIWNKPVESLISEPLSWMNNISSEDKEMVENLFEASGSQNFSEFEYKIMRDDNEVRWVKQKIFSINDNNGNVYRQIIIIEDITLQKKTEEELIFMVYHDPLTNLPNRRSFFERFDELLKQSGREKTIISKALFFIDLDNFKDVNDSLGHHSGDKLLIQVAERLLQCVRKTDYVFRIAGDEFTILLTNISEDVDAAFVAKKIIKEITKPFFVDEQEVFLGISLGVSIYPKDGKLMDKLVKNADIALHHAKMKGNDYKFFNEEMNARAIEKLNIEKQLRYAIPKNEFSLNFQPFVNNSGEIIGMETLIRWTNSQLGFVPPDKFITIAESTGQVIAIGDWVLENACINLKKWIDDGHSDLRMAVNLSAMQLMDINLVKKVQRVIKETGIPPQNLELEITESSVMEKPDEAAIKIIELSKLGISFSIDDFGTGYSSLSYLKKFHIDRLKIDRSFIVDLMDDNDNVEITRAIIAMGHNLNIEVIAEGVETKEQADLLSFLGCNELQGYYFSRPVPSEEFTKLLSLKSLPE